MARGMCRDVVIDGMGLKIIQVTHGWCAKIYEDLPHVGLHAYLRHN